DRFLARRVEEADQAKQDEVLRQLGGSKAARLHARTLEPSERQHALPLSGELVGGAHEVLAIDRLRLAPRDLLSVAVLKNDLGRALDEEDLLTICGLVERRHELVLRLERDGLDARKRSLLSLPVHAELGRERIERALGRVAFHLPGAILLEQLCVVA